jgi:hypothetical protein
VQAQEGRDVWGDFEWLAMHLAKLEPAGESDGAVTRATFAERAPFLVASLEQTLADLEEMRGGAPRRRTTKAAPAN